MRWFQGGIADAVAASKAQNAVFVVFVEGNDDASKNTSSSIETSDVSSKLESDDFVAIKLDSGSESYRQFAQIYQLVPVPSVFFIGTNGVPLEVVAGNTTTPDLLARIDAVLEKCGKVEPKVETATATASPGASVSSSVEEDEAPSTSSVLDSSPNTTSDSTKEQKVEHAKQLLELKRQQTREEEEQAERNREVERRRVGQEVQKLRRWQQEQDLKELREQRQRDKAEETAAKQRVLLQIAQDKAERAARILQEKDQDSKKQAQEGQKREPRADAFHSEVTRIQFRLPDGSTHTRQFPATAALSEVRLYAATTLNMPFREFAMSTTFPRREFTAEDSCQTVRDLELVPTAVILILPAASTAVVSSPGYLSGATRIFWSLLSPLVSIFAYLRSLVFRGSGETASAGSNQRASPEPAEDSSASGPQSARRRHSPSETAAVRRQGNVHRLTNRHDSSDDENNTWNGNSTQQM